MQNFASKSMKRVLVGDGTIRLLPLWSLQSPYAVAYLGVAGLTFNLLPAGRDSGGVRVCCVIGLHHAADRHASINLGSGKLGVDWLSSVGLVAVPA